MSYPDLASAHDFQAVGDDLLPDDPFTALNYHFGMLLGVDDFETEFAYHQGRDRLHQAWLHGAGVVWGLGVGVDAEEELEVRVEPGLAVDGAGRNLHLDAAACLDPAAWYEAHKDDVTPTDPPPAGAEVAFDAHVTARFATCLTRPVPALAEPCVGAGAETAYSRIRETIDLRLEPGLAPEPPDRYRRVRILLGLLAAGSDPADAQAISAREVVLQTSEADRPAAAVAALRAMANADVADLAPPGADGEPRVLTPDDLTVPVVLANIHDLALRRDGDVLKLAGGTVDLLPRRSHIATATIQELTAAALAAAPAPPASAPEETVVTGAQLTGAELALTLSGALDPRSVRAAAFAVSSLGPDGWTALSIDDPPEYDPASLTVTLALADRPDTPWQVIARGAGAAPLVDDELRPLGGGHDFVHIQGS